MKKLFLYLFYQSVKLLVKLIFRVFYAKTVITNKQNLTYNNPGIAISNHPNALIDPLQVASRTTKMQYFLANITMFQHPISNWFFSTFYCIPIERPKDVQGQGKEAQKKRAAQNRKSFAKCNAFLASGGSLYIAPQGAMELERRITKFKTGTARIALSAESENDFGLGLTVLPVGLNYLAANDFRSKLLINVGEPLQVKNYQEAYQEDNFKAVRKMTAELEDRMRVLTIHTVDEEEDRLLQQIETLDATDQPKGMEATFHRSQQVLHELRHTQTTSPKKYDQLKSELANYFNHLQSIGTNDAGFVASQQNSSWQGYLKMLSFVVGLPLFLYGWLNNFLACFIPAWIARKMNLFEGYNSTVKMMSSMLVFPLIYGLQIYLVNRLVGNIGAILYTLSLFPLGLFAWSYREHLQEWRKQQKARQFIHGSPTEAQQLLAQRKTIRDLLTQVQEVYSKAQSVAPISKPKP